MGNNININIEKELAAMFEELEITAELTVSDQIAAEDAAVLLHYTEKEMWQKRRSAKEAVNIKWLNRGWFMPDGTNTRIGISDNGDRYVITKVRRSRQNEDARLRDRRRNRHNSKAELRATLAAC